MVNVDTADNILQRMALGPVNLTQATSTMDQGNITHRNGECDDDRLEDEQDADVTDEIVDGLGDMRSEVMSSGDPLLINHYKAVRMAAGDNDALYDAINAALHDLVEEDDSPKQEAEFQAPTQFKKK